jgi:hypothetical protein
MSDKSTIQSKDLTAADRKILSDYIRARRAAERAKAKADETEILVTNLLVRKGDVILTHDRATVSRRAGSKTWTLPEKLQASLDRLNARIKKAKDEGSATFKQKRWGILFRDSKK